MAAVILLMVISCFYSLNEAAKLPSEIQRCEISKPEIKVCLPKSIEGALKLFKNGVPQLGIPILAPLKITQMVIGQGTGAAVDVVQNFENIDLSGIPGVSILSAAIDYNNDILYAEAIVPKLELIGDYSLDGKILVLPIRGKGKFNVTLENTKILANVSFEKYTKKEKTYWKILEFLVDITPQRMYYQFDDLFDSDARLGLEINKMLNENWDVIFSDVRPGYEQSLGFIFKSIADNLFNRVALSDIFLDV